MCFFAIFLFFSRFLAESITPTLAYSSTHNHSLPDPCENFYNFVCTREKPIGFANSYQNRVWQDVAFLLKHNHAKIHAFRILRWFYRGCSENANKDEFSSQIRHLIRDLKWSTRATNTSWIRLTFHLQEIGINSPLFTVSVDVDYNRKQKILTLKPECPEYCTTFGVSVLYKRYLYLGMSFGAEDRIWHNSQFEIALCKKCKNKSNSNAVYRIKELQKEILYFNWNAFISGELKAAVLEEDHIYVEGIDYFKQLASLLKSTPRNVVINHLITRVALQFLPFFGKRFNTTTEDANICLTLTYKLFPMALNALYIRHYITNITKTIVSNMVTLVTNEFVKSISGNKWMDTNFKIKSVEKLRGMKHVIAHPAEYENNTLIQMLYQDFHPSRKPFLTALLETYKWHKTTKSAYYRRPYSAFDWHEKTDLLIANARYNRHLNSNEIPAGILREPIFSADYPMHSNFGTLGTIIGHEIAHALDSVGIQYDEKGRLIQWQENSIAGYKKRVKCISNKYTNYKIDGVRTVNENFADMNGVVKAYFAYLEWERLRGDRLTSDFSNRQRFWISGANLWCPFEEHASTVYSVHAPKMYRVNGALSNSKEFAEDFGCARGTTMNSEVKCQLI